jgi:hypothetical protein
MKRALFFVLLGALAACGPASTPGGTVVFGYSASDMVRTSANLKDPLFGTVYGNIYLQEDVSVTGPRTGAAQLGDVELANVDLRTATTSDAKWTSQKLMPGNYVFLGFLDVDGNGAQTTEPDPGDPVTLALTNKFTIRDGEQTKRSVLFELVFN